MPATFSGRLACAAMSVMGIVEVLVAKMAFGPAIASNSPSTCRLTSIFSTTASTTSSQRANPFQSMVEVMRASLRAISPRVMRRRSTFFFQIFAAAFMPPPIAFQLMSRIRTEASVLSAMSWAMPPPMMPAPRTPASRTSIGVAAIRSFFDSSIMKKRRMRFCATSACGPTMSGTTASTSRARPRSTPADMAYSMTSIAASGAG